MINYIPIQLCSSCLKHEITSWVNERVNDLNSKAKEKIREELKAIKLISGECIVCKKTQLADDSFFNILRILEKTRAEKNIMREFAGMFSYEKTEFKGEFLSSLF